MRASTKNLHFFYISRGAFESQERRKRGQVLNKKKNFRHLSEGFYGSNQELLITDGRNRNQM